MVAEIINFSLNWPDFGVGGGVKISKKKIKVLELSEKARNAIKIICCRCVFSIGRGNYLIIFLTKSDNFYSCHIFGKFYCYEIHLFSG